MSFIWYKEQAKVPWHFYNDSKDYLQMDKAGHVYSAYRLSYAGYYALRWAGINKKKALLYGASLGMVFQTPIEIYDALYEDWGFSWYDVIANTFGSVLFACQQYFFNEQIFLLKFSYSPSIYPGYHDILGQTHLEHFFYDYNAHTYWLSGNINRLINKKKIIPWLNIAFGYSVNGVIYASENPKLYQDGTPFPLLERYRQYLISLDIDFSKIRTNKKWLRRILRAVNLIKLPFPALEINRIDGIKFRALYF